MSKEYLEESDMLEGLENIEVTSETSPIEKKKETDYNLEVIYTKPNIEINAVKYEMNIIDLPIFSRDKNIRVNTKRIYKFDANNSMEIIPISGDKIPGDFDEKVFIAISKLATDKKNPQVLVTSFPELIRTMGLKNVGAIKTKVKQSIVRLASTHYKFTNILYQNATNNRMNSEIGTALFSSYKFITYEDATYTSTSQDEMNCIEVFTDNRIKEYVVLEFANFIQDNLKSKGYLWFDTDVLFSIKDAIARSIHMIVKKRRNTKLKYQAYSRFIASRVPLAWDRKSKQKTVQRIHEALEELKNEKLMDDFEFVLNDKIDDSFFWIYFSDKHNKNIFTEQAKETYTSVELDVEEKILKSVMADENTIEILYSKLSPAKQNEDGKRRVETILTKYPELSFEYILKAFEYSRKRAKKNFWGYVETVLRDKLLDDGEVDIVSENQKTIPAAVEETEVVIDSVLVEKIYNMLSQNEKSSFLKHELFVANSKMKIKFFEVEKDGILLIIKEEVASKEYKYIPERVLNELERENDSLKELEKQDIEKEVEERFLNLTIKEQKKFEEQYVSLGLKHFIPTVEEYIKNFLRTEIQNELGIEE